MFLAFQPLPVHFTTTIILFPKYTRGKEKINVEAMRDRIGVYIQYVEPLMKNCILGQSSDYGANSFFTKSGYFTSSTMIP